MRTLILPICLLLSGWGFGGCATTSEQGRTRMLAPREIGAVYSGIEMQARLAVSPETGCPLDDCLAVDHFRARVMDLAERVATAAYRLAGERDLDVPHFVVAVPGKDDVGTLSNASGNIVVFDGLRGIPLADAALAFLIAREMGHVLGQHHEENSALSLTVSVAVALLFPMTNILRGVETAYTATAASASLASTAVSLAGSRILRRLYRSNQLREADQYALEILVRAGWQPREVADALYQSASHIGDDGWLAELQETRKWLDAIVSGPPMPEGEVAVESGRTVEDVPPPATEPMPTVAPVAETTQPDPVGSASPLPMTSPPLLGGGTIRPVPAVRSAKVVPTKPCLATGKKSRLMAAGCAKKAKTIPSRLKKPAPARSVAGHAR